ncbi:MAG: tetraacyldisaccharide 4'-kinase, partial [Desulfobacterales bacterium]|nr:tetraacyldisaccharide 4'-kinase [Desulfobacterales bacterium]
MFKSLTDKITRISGQDISESPGFTERCLAGISGVYSAVVGIRSFLYDKGILQSKQLPCPVISIGNIVAGGAGKTPTTVYLAGILRDLGYRPVVVSRGYKGNLKKEAAVVGDGSRVFLDADTAGEEPHMMAAAGQFPVVVGKKRYLAGRLALKELADPDVNVVILDDGFQHRALDRNLNLVLFDYRRPLGNGR